MAAAPDHSHDAADERARIIADAANHFASLDATTRAEYNTRFDAANEEARRILRMSGALPSAH